jgi:hypothetical protein
MHHTHYPVRVKLVLDKEKGVSAGIPIPIAKDVYDKMWEPYSFPKPGKSMSMSSEEYDRFESIVQDHIDASDHPNADVRDIIQG